MDGVWRGPRYIPGAGPNYTKRIRFVYLNDQELTRDMSLDWKYYGETISAGR